MAPRLRSLTILVVAGSLALVTASIPAAARDKPEPAPQWAVDAAKTPTPANIKDAPAVVLFHEYLITVDDRNHAIERERFAVRILQPQGRRYAHCSAWYDIDAKLNYFRSWTIAPDGRQFKAMETDFIDHGAYAGAEMQFTERVRLVNPPAGDPGSVVVCETEENLRPYMSEEDWEIQATIPIVFRGIGARPASRRPLRRVVAQVPRCEAGRNRIESPALGDQGHARAGPRESACHAPLESVGRAHVSQMGRCGRQGRREPVARHRAMAGAVGGAPSRSHSRNYRRGPAAHCRRARFLHQTEPRHQLYPEEHPLLRRRAGHRRLAGALCRRHLSQPLR